jgi:putative nucleotidyltransferase with HDIG domain
LTREIKHLRPVPLDDAAASESRSAESRSAESRSAESRGERDEQSIPPTPTDALAVADAQTARRDAEEKGASKRDPVRGDDVRDGHERDTGLHRRGGRLRIDERRGVLGGALRLLLLLLVASCAAFLLAPRLVRGDLPDDEALVGTPARSFVKADRDYALVDHEVTAALREAASARSASVWDLDTTLAQREATVVQKGLVRLAVALEPVRAAQQAAIAAGQPPPKTPRELERALSHAMAAAEPVRAVLAGELAPVGLEAPRDDVWSALVHALWTSPGVIDAIQARLVEALGEPVVVDSSLLAREMSRSDTSARGIVVRAVPARPGGEQLRGIEGILDVAAARQRAAQRIAADVVEKAEGVISAAQAEALGAFMAGLMRATLTYNAAESDQRRRSAAESVPPVIVRAHRGEIVIRPGEIITPRHHMLVVAMKVQQAGNARTSALLGTGFFVGLLCLVVYLFGARRVFRRTLRTKDLAFLALLELTVLLGIVAADAAAPFLQQTLQGIPAGAVFFAVPVAFGAMTARLTLPPDVALLFSLVTALLGGVVVEPGMAWAVAAMVTSLTGAAGVSRSHRRSTMLLAGVGAGLVGAFAALTLELFRGALVGTELFWLLGSTVVGGALSGLLVVFITPIVERVFGYVTEQRLYKLADLNHPLLKDLVVHAPGTWHHSIRTAELAEAAAKSVSASPILARVMALYHDVGKMKQPQLFGENQKGDNPHDRMEPAQSADVLRAHVDEGVKLALEHGLPRAVIAAIEEHHVDNLMEHFYAKARADDAAGARSDPRADAAAFRYRGRAPTTRESALVMLADQIEAAARNLDEQTPERLCDLVDALVNRAITDDTLSECDLSLRDLGRAREALQRALLKVHRQ